MTDVLLSWDNQAGSGSLTTQGSDLALTDGLVTAIVVSLFTDRRASDDDLPPGQSDRRGWWADAVADDEIGSHLWLLDREKRTLDVPVKAEEYARAALAWLVTDGRLDAVAVAAELIDDLLGIFVELTLPSGASVEFQFNLGL